MICSLHKTLLLTLFCLSGYAFSAFIAILETTSIDEIITLSEKRFLTDELRAQAGEALPAYMNYTIMTRENINVMLPPGKSLEECEGTCVAETGRNIAADYVAQARVGSFGENLTLTVELYETSSGKLLGSFTAMKETANLLWQEIKNDSKTLFLKVQEEEGRKGALSDGSAWNESPMARSKSKGSKSVEKVAKFLNDPRDGNKYRVAVIGGDVWMAENLRFVTKDSECYDGAYKNCQIYGRLYSFADAMNMVGKCDANSCEKFLSVEKNRRGICPKGFHIPTSDEWNGLAEYVSEKVEDGVNEALTLKFGWTKLRSNNRSGFGVIPGGFRFMNGGFMGLSKEARFWSSTESDNMDAIGFRLNADYPGLRDSVDPKKNEYSVRCVADK